MTSTPVDPGTPSPQETSSQDASSEHSLPPDTAPPDTAPQVAASEEAAMGGAGPRPSGEAGFNRLARETSPYLLLHRDNPVDWYPWGEEALRKAREEDKPIFLSVGYSTCYWCHVMERESFTDPAVAALLKESFISIKVDREERPDLDEIYMAATQVMTQSGGWPNSVFLTPELEPFFAGTYFPPEDRYGRPGFSTVLRRLAQLWGDERERLEASAREVTEHMERVLSGGEPSMAPPLPSVADRSLEMLDASFDADNGGFGSAPKFPSPSNLLLLLERLEAPDGWGAGAPSADASRRLLDATLDAMARGGIYDQAGGGFHRYATDARWLVPHFEKMLYDNGFLLEIYARAHALDGDPRWRQVVLETARWLERELTGPDGELWSAIDAESEDVDGEHREGAYYAWTAEQLEEALGAEGARRWAPVLGFAGDAFFEEHAYVLHRPSAAPLDDATAAGLESAEAQLLAARYQRPRPLTDDKVLTDWNGITITGLVTAGRLLEQPELVQRGARAADFVLRHLRDDDGTLLHVWRRGPDGGASGGSPEGAVAARHAAYLADYAFFIRGLLALHQATGEERWLKVAQELGRQQVERLADSDGGFHTAAAAPDLILRGKDSMDGALPSANAIAALNFLELERRTGDALWGTLARRTLAAFADLANRAPHALRLMTVAARRMAASPGAGTSGVEAVDTGAVDGSPISKSSVAHSLARQALSLVAVSATFDAADGDGGRAFAVALEIEDGWHVNAHPAAEGLIATEVRGVGATVDAVTYPAGQPLAAAFAEEPVPVWSGSVEIRGRVTTAPPASAPTEEEGDEAEETGATAGSTPALEVRYQACADDRCLPPVTRRLMIPSTGDPRDSK